MVVRTFQTCTLEGPLGGRRGAAVRHRPRIDFWGWRCLFDERGEEGNAFGSGAEEEFGLHTLAFGQQGAGGGLDDVDPQVQRH